MPDAIGIDEVLELLDAGAQLVEVLPEKEYEQEHLPDALSLPLEELDRAAATGCLDPGRPVVVYCYDAL
jgi:rhodanese-related sulfurtransferase